MIETPWPTRCPTCGAGNPDPIMLVDRQGVPPGEEGHNITYAHVLLGECHVCGHGLIETRSHDCFDFDEVWDQYEWYDLVPADVRYLRDLAACCTDPLAVSCTCATHLLMRATCQSLPVHRWSSALEAEAHLHHVSLGTSAGVDGSLTFYLA